MKKDSTQNTFQNGIIQDIDPSQLPNNCLYSCLNGTYVTKDGNQYALQNDMGNIKVEQIKLPSGYVPVGLCNHGGITYIASYNPIENKGQIGSFPAPQENIFLSNENNIEDNITFNDKSLLQVSKQLFNSDQIIRPGDKFSLQVSEDSQLLNYKLISGATEKIDLCPKKRAISVSVCVLDSNGNLHDITNTLKRFKYSNFNSIFESLNNSTSSVDQNNLIPSNIYNCKITGPLYLVYTLNGIISTDISASFFKGPLDNISQFITLIEDPILEKIEVKENELCVLFDVTYKYNCPDGFYAQNYFRFNTLLDLRKKQLLNIYGDKYTYDPTNIIKGILCKYNGKNTILPFKISSRSLSLSIPTLNNNIYTSRQRYLLNGINIQELKNLEFDLTPSLIYCPQNNLASSLNVNIEKLNSGEVSINQWKYFVDNNEITLTWGLNAYPFIGTRLSNVRLEFYNLLSTNTTINSELELSRIEQENTFYYDQDDWGNSIQLNDTYTINNQKIQNNQLSFNFNMKIPISEIKNVVSDYKDFGQGGYSPNSLSIDQITCTYSENGTQIKLQNLKFEITTDNDNQEDPYCINKILSKINSIQFISNELVSNEEYTFNNPQININTSFETDPNNEYLVLSGTFSINIIGKYGNYSNLEYVLPIKERSSYFGTFTNVITSLNKKSVYCVLLKYQLANEQNELYDTIYTAGVRTMFTTPLLNDLYTTVQDYNDMPSKLYTKYYTYNIQSDADFNITDKQEILSNDANIIYDTQSSNPEEQIKTECSLQGKLNINTHTNDDKYPFNVTVNKVEKGSVDIEKTEADYKTKGNIQLNPEDIQYNIDDFNINDNFNSDTKEYGFDINVKGRGYSIYKGKLAQKEINFTKPLVEYFPTFEYSSLIHVKEKRNELFGYDNLNNDTKIVYGITYRGLDGHLDHHGVKYIELTKNQNNEEILTDLHESIYGFKWYDGEEEVFKCGNSRKIFYLADFMNNLKVLDKYNNIDFIYLDAEGVSNRTINEHDHGHNNDNTNIAGDDKYTSDNISNFVYCDRQGAESWDFRIMKKGWHKMLLWKNNNTWILIKNSKSGFTSNDIISSPDLFTKKFNNIYIKRDTIITQKAYIYNTTDYLYTTPYNITKTEKLSYKVQYNIGNYNQRISNNIKLLNNLDEKTINTLLKYLIFNNIKNNDFDNQNTEYKNNFENEFKQNISVSFKINGTEQVYNDIKTLNSTPTYIDPVIITQNNKIHFRDSKGAQLLENQVYEINNNTVEKFGTNLTNSVLSKYIVIEDGIIYPNTKMCSNKYYNTTLTEFNNDSHYDTVLKLGKINCLEIPLT